MDKDLRRTFYYPEDLETFDDHRKLKGHKRFYEPTEKCKHKREDGYTDMNTLLRYTEANNLKNEKLKASLSPTLTTFCQRNNHPYNKQLTNLTCSGPYCGILALGRFCTDFAALGPYCHDLGPIFPSTALALG